MAVEMSQLYIGKRESSNKSKLLSTETESNSDEEEITIAIELSLKKEKKILPKQICSKVNEY